MTGGKEKESQSEVIIVSDVAGMQLYLSEKAANRLSWILTGVFALISIPVFVLAIICI